MPLTLLSPPIVDPLSALLVVMALIFLRHFVSFRCSEGVISCPKDMPTVMEDEIGKNKGVLSY